MIFKKKVSHEPIWVPMHSASSKRLFNGVQLETNPGTDLVMWFTVD